MICQVSTTYFGFPPAGYGEFIATQHWNQETGRFWLTVERADPRILIAAPLLRLLAQNPEEFPAWQRQATLTEAESGAWQRDDFTDAVLRIHAENRLVIYHITNRHDAWTWAAEWPD